MIRANLLRMAAGVCIFALTLLCAADEDVWVEVKSPHFIVISNASAKQARRVAKTLEQFRLVFNAAIPNLRTDPGSPLIVMAARDTRSLRALLPEERQGKNAAQPAGLFLASPDRNFILLRADASSDQDYHVIYHEYVHMIMRLNFPSLPLWLNEGLAELFGYATITDGFSGLGRVKPEYLEILRSSWIPLPVLMAVTQDSPYYHQKDRSEIFYTQSWALAHYMLLGNPQATRHLTDLLQLLQKGVPEKEAMERTFGDLKTLERDLQRYVRSNRFNYLPVETSLKINENQFEERTLSEAESLSVRGEVLVNTNRLQEARELLDRALRLDPKSAHANEGMGFLFMSLKEMDIANKYFLAAAQLDSKRYLAQYYAAQFIYKRGGDYNSAENYLRKAIAINPSFAPAYDLLSCVLATQDAKLTEALRCAKMAATLEPSVLRHRINIATIQAKMGNLDEALSLGEHLLPLAQTAEDQNAIHSLLLFVKNQRERTREEAQRANALREERRKIEARRKEGEELERRFRIEEAARKAKASAKPVKTGAAGILKGSIKSVQCSGSAALEIDLSVNGKLRRLRADNYYRVQFWAIDAKGKSGFQPCTELQGKRVEVEFLSVSGQEYSGLIKSISIEK